MQRLSALDMANAYRWLAGFAALAAFSCVGHIEESPAALVWQGPGAARDADGPISPATERSRAGGPAATGPAATGATAPSNDDGQDLSGALGRAATSGWPAFGAERAFQLRRLTARQYDTALQSLLGVDTSAMPAVERVSPVGGFEEIGAAYASVSEMGVGQFEEAARYAAKAAFAADGPGRTRVPCTPTGANDSACFSSFAREFGRKAFRRPLSDEELTRYVALTTEVAKSTGDAWQALEATTSAFLQSPNFLYLTELAEPDPSDKQRYRYTSFEMASRLAYFLTGDTPDDALLMAAEQGALLDPDGIAGEVLRLLGGASARSALARYFTSLLSLDNLDTLARPTEVYPEFTPTLGAALKQETLLTIDDMIFERDGDYRQLFDQSETFVNAELAKLYGVSPPSAAGFMRVSLPPSTHRAGLLGQAGVLAARDHSDGTSPTRRGLFVLTRLLCQNLPLMPPANLQIPQPPTGKLSARQRLQEHTTNPVCAGCHRITDPVGLSLEHFNALGVYHEDDHGMAIDDSGEIDGQSYRGAIELGALLHDHPALSPCLIQSLYGVAVGHLATDFDRATFAKLVQGFEDDGARVRELLTQITASDGFRYLPLPASDSP